MDRYTKNFALAIVILIFTAAAAVLVLCFFIPKLAGESLLFDTMGCPIPFAAAMYVGCAAALLSMLFIYGWYQHFSIIVCVFILLFGALCAFTLSRVFARAVEYKAENDLTV